MMNTIDIILGIFLLLGLVRGFFKGFLLELSGLLALIAGIYAAIHFSAPVQSFLSSFIGWEERYLSLLAFALTFFAVVIVISLIGKILTKMASLIALGIINRLLGAVFGLLKMAFLASIFLMFLNQTQVMALEEETTESSILYEPVAKMAPLLLPTIIREINEGELFNPSSEEPQNSPE